MYMRAVALMVLMASCDPIEDAEVDTTPPVDTTPDADVTVTTPEPDAGSLDTCTTTPGCPPVLCPCHR
jgi:hypothetical protein